MGCGAGKKEWVGVCVVVVVMVLLSGGVEVPRVVLWCCCGGDGYGWCREEREPVIVVVCGVGVRGVSLRLMVWCVVMMW